MGDPTKSDKLINRSILIKGGEQVVKVGGLRPLIVYCDNNYAVLQADILCYSMAQRKGYV